MGGPGGLSSDSLNDTSLTLMSPQSGGPARGFSEEGPFRNLITRIPVHQFHQGGSVWVAKEKELRARIRREEGWFSRHPVMFQNGSVSAGERSYFDHFRDFDEGRQLPYSDTFEMEPTGAQTVASKFFDRQRKK